ncbi:MAG: glycoside hydrolase family 38 C-terminal domain-containing protein [Gammaproteobacteria bacterium]|nr:glycoside hydrolase family 38 C-terminal domain-containing protein [Gammaproteobacteria bacterium]
MRVASLPATARKLENDLIRIDFATNGEIQRIYDKAAARDVLPPGESANLFKLYEDLPLAYEAWDIDAFYLEKTPRRPRFVTMRLLENGPLISVIEQVWEDENYRITQRIALRQNDRIIEFDTEVDWNESQHMLRVDFPVNVRAAQANFEIQFGHVARPTHTERQFGHGPVPNPSPTSGSTCRNPTMALHYFNDSKYGHRVQGNTISLNLLRSPTRPDPKADRRVHRFRYALYPHPGDLVTAEVVRPGLGIQCARPGLPYPRDERRAAREIHVSRL